MDFSWQVSVYVDERTTEESVMLTLTVGNIMNTVKLPPRTAGKMATDLKEAVEHTVHGVIAPTATEISKFQN